MLRIGRVLLVVLGVLLVPVLVAVVAIPRSSASVYPEPGPRTLADAELPEARPLDPTRPTVAIVIGDEGANVADTLPPFEAFARAGGFNVVLVSPTQRLVPLLGGLDVVPDFTFADLDRALPRPPEVIVVPQIHGSSSAVVEWVRRQHEAGAPLVMSVCVGAEVVADAGLLADRPATSHWLGLIGLRRSHPDIDWVEGQRFVDTGEVVTTAGVLSGVDGALRVIERLMDAGTAQRVRDTAYLHRNGGEFAFDGALRDVASTYDAATATWVAKSLQYPRPILPADARAWPWSLTLRLLLLAAAGGLLALMALRITRRLVRRP